MQYETETGVYFDESLFPDFGKLSHQSAEDLEKHWIEPDPTKRNSGDFALWKKRQEGEGSGPFDHEVVWDSPWGRGRPGWHIEDTAITETYFGPQYDIHGGAMDLIFPHHEAEIAQMEAASGKKPLVRYWMHTGFLKTNRRINEERISQKGLHEAKDFLSQAGDILGLNFFAPAPAKSQRAAGMTEDRGRGTTGEPTVEGLMELLIATRQKLREKKEWQLADSIRNGMKEMGISIEDSSKKN